MVWLVWCSKIVMFSVVEDVRREVVYRGINWYKVDRTI